MCEFNTAETRENAINLLRVFNRQIFEEEYYLLKATNILTKNILNNIKFLNLEKNDIIFAKTEKFKDILFILLKNSLNIKSLKPLTHYKINENYLNTLSILKFSIFESALNEADFDCNEIATIIISFIDYVENLLDYEVLKRWTIRPSFFRS